MAQTSASRFLNVPTAVCALSLAAFCASLLLHPRMPALGDFGDWTYEAVLLRDLIAGHAHAGYIFKHYPVPNSFNTVVIALLSFVTGWHLAAKLYLCLQLAIGFFCALHLARTVRPNPALWLVLPGIFCGLNFWYGFTNFQVGVAWAMLICSLLLRGDRSIWKYSLLFVLIFFTHMIPTAFAGLAFVLFIWQRRREPDGAPGFSPVNAARKDEELQPGRSMADSPNKLLLALIPVALLTLWYIAGRFFAAHNADAAAHIEAPVRYGSGAFVAYKINSWLKSFGFVNPSTNDDHSVALRLLGDQLFRVLFLFNALLAGIFAVLIARRARLAFKQHLAERFLWWTALVFGIVYILAPGIALGVSDPGSRALQVALWIVIFLAADTSRFATKASWIAGIAALALLAANLTMFVRLASSPVVDGATQTTVARPVAKFCHVFYEDKTQYYDDIERGQFNEDIFPTGMFLKK